MLIAVRDGNSAATRLFRCGLRSVKESEAICAIIDKFVRNSYMLSKLTCVDLRQKDVEQIVESPSSMAETEACDRIEFGHGEV